MSVIRLLQVLLLAWVVSAAIPLSTLERRTSNFVTTDNNGQFLLDGQRFRFFATNAYWLPVLEDEADIDLTLSSIAKLGIKVVRIFAFNDVDQIPNKGTWFQLIAGGTTQINDGPNGLQKLDIILQLAQKHGIFVILSLTNNWDPRASGAHFNTPRNFLSNDYGGMDLYVRNIAAADHHDEFYTNPKVLSAFSDYVSHVVQRYAGYASLLGWELANDPRCYSTLPASPACNPQTITAWHAQIAKLVKSLDPHHLVSSGNQGFLCVGCPKLFSWHKRESRLEARSMLTEIRRNGQLSAFDGSHGVDNEDILSIPDIDFSTFQIFPGQATYGPDHPDLSPVDNTAQVGVDWIQTQAAIGAAVHKPVVTTAFGIVTLQNAPFFVPFNGSEAPFFDFQPGPVVRRAPPPANFAVTNAQRNAMYAKWAAAGSGATPPGRRRNNQPMSPLQGMAFYQFSQDHLKPNDVIPASGQSPNDGYSIAGSGQQDFINQVILPAVQEFSG
jgi:mannan endo-1,4-beta-mannosidase